MPKLTPEQLEKLIDSSLRALPPRRAPQALESKVWAAIQKQEALPWWRHSFGHWPVAARMVFLIFSGMIAATLIATWVQVSGRMDAASTLDGLETFWSQAQKIVTSVQALRDWVLRYVPSQWLYGAVAFVAVMYIVLLGLGVTAYRTLFSHR